MNESPKVYFIVLNFNAYKDTIECLKSLKAITYPNYEIVVVDNASKDNSFEKISETFKDITLLRSENNYGYANGNNIGIKYTLSKKAEYVCILNNDVVVEKNFLEPLMERMLIEPQLGLIGPCICDFYQRDHIQAMGSSLNMVTGLTRARLKNDLWEEHKEEEREVGYLGGACFIIKAEVFNKIGFIPENYFLFFEETEFCLKALQSEFKMLCLAKSRVYHKGSFTISKYSGLSYFFLNRNRVIFMRRNANKLEFTLFSIYLFIEALGRIVIRREKFKLFSHLIEGFSADKNNIDLEKVNYYMKSR